MTDHLEATALHRGGEHARGFGPRQWTAANAVGLGSAYALMALFGGGAERWLGVDHDAAARDVAVFAGLVLGAALFVVLRQRVLSRSVAGAWWLATAAGAALSVGFVVGFVVAGPPLDFVLGAVTLGTIGGGLQWRSLDAHGPASRRGEVS
jgi:hypothetical protein